MPRKMSDSDIIKQAYEELEFEGDNTQTTVVDKVAFDISINPASVVGAITGAAVAGHHMKKDILKRQMQSENSSIINGNYYSQVQNIINNLKIIFTPLGVLFVVKNGAKEISIENIATEEMNPDMYQAWKNKNYEYYKNLLLNKMLSEIQFVEQEFAKNIIQKQLKLSNNIINKKAFEEDENEEDTEVIAKDLGIFEITEYTARTKDVYSKSTPLTEKLAGKLLDLVDDGTSYKIEWGFNRPIEKYAFLANKLDFLGLNIGSKDIRSLQGSYLNPMYLSNRVKIGYLPDRVLFTVDNKVISSLLAIDMNSESFEKFEQQDSRYFVKLFKLQIEKGLARMRGKIPAPKGIENKQEKIAALSNDISQIFLRPDIHPEVYRVALTKRYANRWYDFDATALVRIIESDFGLAESGIADIPLNKILSIYAINNSYIPFRSAHGFEKVIRSFNDKPIDFMRAENDLVPAEIAFGIDATDIVTPEYDTYEYLGADVFNYVINAMIKNNWIFFSPSQVSKSQYKDDFYEQLNKYLLNAVNKRDIDAIEDEKVEAAAIHYNEIIAKLVKDILTTIRSKKLAKGVTPGNFIDAMLSKMGDIPENVKLVIRTQILDNISIDIFLSTKRNFLREQLKFFNLI